MADQFFVSKPEVFRFVTHIYRSNGPGLSSLGTPTIIMSRDFSNKAINWEDSLRCSSSGLWGLYYKPW